jgi:hypothetical protein
MARLATTQALASVSNAAGATKETTALAVNQGVSGVAKVTNGATGPTVGVDVIVQVNNDGGSTWHEWSRQTMPVTNSGVYNVPIGLSPGNGGDWLYYRVQFAGNTGQAVTVQYDGSTTTAF